MKSVTYYSDCGMFFQLSKTFPLYLNNADLNTLAGSFYEIKPAGIDGIFTEGVSYDKKIVICECTIVGTSKADIDEIRCSLSMAMNIHFGGYLVAVNDLGKQKKYVVAQ